jgi:mRNA interferase HicA
MPMKAAELLRRLRRLANRRGWDFSISEGSNHTKVRINGKQTVVPRHASDLKTGTLRGILKQIDVTPDDLEN